MKTKKGLIGLLGLVVLLIGGIYALADSETTTLTFVIPSEVDHSISYTSPCSTSVFYFIESDSNKNGTQTHINVTDASSNPCQNVSTASMTINNIGSVNVNVTTNITDSALPSGITLKVAQNDTGYESTCSGPPVNETDCASITYGAAVTVITDLTAQTGTDDLWWWVDMSNFNNGVATTGITRTLSTHGTDNS